MRPEKTILLRALSIHKREHDAGQFWMRCVEKTVGSEVNVAVLAQYGTSSNGPVGIEIKRLETISFRHQRQNPVSFSSGEKKTMNLRHFV